MPLTKRAFTVAEQKNGTNLRKSRFYCTCYTIVHFLDNIVHSSDNGVFLFSLSTIQAVGATVALEVKQVNVASLIPVQLS